jgi:hypothetical protein
MPTCCVTNTDASALMKAGMSSFGISPFVLTGSAGICGNTVFTVVVTLRIGAVSSALANSMPRAHLLPENT